MRFALSQVRRYLPDCFNRNVSTRSRSSTKNDRLASWSLVIATGIAGTNWKSVQTGGNSSTPDRLVGSRSMCHTQGMVELPVNEYHWQLCSMSRTLGPVRRWMWSLLPHRTEIEHRSHIQCPTIHPHCSFTHLSRRVLSVGHQWWQTFSCF